MPLRCVPMPPIYKSFDFYMGVVLGCVLCYLLLYFGVL